MHDFCERYIAARKKVIGREFAKLNPQQRQACLATEGPLLLLAGAGSGKTTVLINRVANLLKYGRGSDTDEVPRWATEEDLAFLENYPACPTEEEAARAVKLCAVEPAAPWSVIAITFTNKAAGELKERLERMLDADKARDIWAATFHSACVRILRRDIERIGFSKDFTIYDTDDSKRVIKDILKEQNLDEKTFQPREILAIISSSKDALIPPEELARQADAVNDWKKSRVARVYHEYLRRLRAANALDFDDIILHTVHLLQACEDVREYYQRKFRYVLVDEYQDTNHLQYLLTSLLAGGRKNICVVGDDDQSIYRFRGANIENILSFEKQYKNARVIRLEQNYRSTEHILNASNAVIRNNTGRKGKTLWTENGQGDKVTIRTVFNESDEANFVVSQIMSAYTQGRNWKENAVLYRMNAQSNALEYAFKRNAVPYKIIGGMKFFDRAEVKDMLSYLCVVNNPTDDLRLKRIINTPARGIGPTSVEKMQRIAAGQRCSMYEVAANASAYPELHAAASKLEKFATLIRVLQKAAETMELTEFYEFVCRESGYVRALEEKNDMESRGRLENVQELKSSIVTFLENEPENPSLAGFLDEIALYTDLDSQDDSDNCVVLMTMHSAKGLEFPSVYVVGMEDGIFPGTRAMGETEEMEEERRLCYVAMTRAKERLTMTNARQRMLFGRTQSYMPSRFLKEIPEAEMVWLGKPEPHRSADPDMGSSYYDGMTMPRREGVKSGYTKPAAPVRVSGGKSAAGSASASMGMLQLNKGDMINHKAFGKGMVISVRPMGGDALIEVAFDGVGTKKLMLKSASAHISKL